MGSPYKFVLISVQDAHFMADTTHTRITPASFSLLSSHLCSTTPRLSVVPQTDRFSLLIYEWLAYTLFCMGGRTAVRREYYSRGVTFSKLHCFRFRFDECGILYIASGILYLYTVSVV